MSDSQIPLSMSIPSQPPSSMPILTSLPIPPLISMPTPSIPNTDVKDIARFIYLNLYSNKKENQKKAIKTFYDVNADIQSITDSEIAGNHHLVCIDSIIKFQSPLLFPCLRLPCLRLIFGKNNKFSEITMRILTRLEFNEQQKIVRHEDIWSLKDLVESLPIVGFLYADVARKFNAMVTGCAVIAAKEVAHALEEWNI
ncbi:4372_t:CDS:2 [Rhizophagus irregularis]|nr:4372_t:CDS:2 [Rhizophagus irregularis]